MDIKYGYLGRTFISCIVMYIKDGCVWWINNIYIICISSMYI